MAMLGLALAVALYSLRFAAVPAHVWLEVDPGIRRVIVQHPVAALTHMLVGPLALALGPTQFWPGFRARHLRGHRWAGRVYVAACAIAAMAGLATAFHASGGPIAGLGFGVLALLWITSTLGGWRAAVRHDMPRHRLLMRVSYALTFSAVTLRLQIPLGFALGAPSYSAMSVWLAWTAWLPNLVAVAVWNWWEELGRNGLMARNSDNQAARWP